MKPLRMIVATLLLGVVVLGCNKRSKAIEACGTAKSDCLQKCIAQGSDVATNPCNKACFDTYSTCMDAID